MTDESNEAATQQDTQQGDEGGGESLQSLHFVIAETGHGTQWRVGAQDPATGSFIHHAKFDIEDAAKREKFIDALVAKSQLPGHEVAAKRATLLAALEAEVGEIVQSLMAGDGEGSPAGEFPVPGAPCIINYMNAPGGKVAQAVGMNPQGIAAQLFETTDGFPKRAGNHLFALAAEHEVIELGSTNKLFAWMRLHAHVEWEKGPSLLTAEQFYEHLAMTAEAYDAVEVLPHHPEIPGIYYAHPPVPSGVTGRLDELLGMFNPATEADRELIRALVLTLFWGGALAGGPPGQRQEPEALLVGPRGDHHRADHLGQGAVPRRGPAAQYGLLAADLQRRRPQQGPGAARHPDQAGAAAIRQGLGGGRAAVHPGEPLGAHRRDHRAAPLGRGRGRAADAVGGLGAGRPEQDEARRRMPGPDPAAAAGDGRRRGGVRGGDRLYGRLPALSGARP